MVGGVAALVCAWMVGPRHGRFVKHYILDGHTYAKTQDQPLVSQTDAVWMEIISDETAGTASGEEWRSVSIDKSKELSQKDEAGELTEFTWKSNPFPNQSSTFQTFGCLILWFGWYGFNGASTLMLSGGASGIAAKVIVTTTMAAAGGALSTGLLYYVLDGIMDLGSMSNGILAGLVSITAGCATTEPWAALLIGCLGGGVYYVSVLLLEALRIDDVVLAIPVHGFCGLWGVLAVGLFSSPISTYASYGRLSCGLFYAGSYGCDNAGDQFAAQLVFALSIIGWVGATTFLVLIACKLVLGCIVTDSMDQPWTGPSESWKTPLAYDSLAQMYGMDVMKHGGLSGTESLTVHSSPTYSTTAPSSPKPRKRRSSVVGQSIMPAKDDDKRP